RQSRDGAAARNAHRDARRRKGEVARGRRRAPGQRARPRLRRPRGEHRVEPRAALRRARHGGRRAQRQSPHAAHRRRSTRMRQRALHRSHRLRRRYARRGRRLGAGLRQAFGYGSVERAERAGRRGHVHAQGKEMKRPIVLLALALTIVGSIALAEKMDPRRPKDFTVGLPKGSWPTARMDVRRRAMTDLALPRTLKKEWSRASGAAGLETSPLVDEKGEIVIVNARGELILLDDKGGGLAHVRLG